MGWVDFLPRTGMANRVSSSVGKSAMEGYMPINPVKTHRDKDGLDGSFFI
jgi:hypothetical protein